MPQHPAQQMQQPPGPAPAPQPPQPGVEQPGSGVPQSARLALNTIESLQKLSEALAKPDAPDSGNLRQTVEQLTGDLSAFVENVTGVPADRAQESLQQESQKRSEGQLRRHARLEACEPGTKRPKKTQDGRLPAPQQQGQPAQTPQAPPRRIPTRQMG